MQRLKMSDLITDAVLNELQRHYNGLRLEINNDDILVSGISDKDTIKKVEIDLEFYLDNSELPLENLCCRLDNYEPHNDLQKELLEYAHKLLDLDTAMTGGIYAWGAPGVGKSHVAIGIAKEFMSKGQDVYFLSAENYRLPDNLGPNQVFIFDDLNSPYGTYKDNFKKAVINIHNKGGRIFVTSNISYDEFMDHALKIEEKQRYMDRTKQMFKVLHIEGDSQREQKAWYQ